MTKLRRYLDKQGKGSLAKLAEATGRSHTLLSRIADGHRAGSAKTVLAIAEVTGIRPRDLLPKSITQRTKPRKLSTARGRA